MARYKGHFTTQVKLIIEKEKESEKGGFINKFFFGF